MRHLAAIAISTALLLTACSDTGPGDVHHAPVAPASMFFERELAFCSPAPADKIVIGYYGASVLDTTVHLYVLCQGKDTVFHDSWDSELFLQAGENGLADSVATDRVHTRMRDLLAGKLALAGDSTACAKAAFSYAVQSHQRCIAWSADAAKVDLLVQHD